MDMSRLDILPYDLSICLLGDYVEQARKNKKWKEAHVAFTQNLGGRFMFVGGNGVAGHRVGEAYPHDFNLAWVVKWYDDYAYVSERPVVGGLDEQLWLAIGNEGIDGNNRFADNDHDNFVRGFVRLCEV